MNQDERRAYLIRTLLNEYEEYKTLPLPQDEEDQQRLLRTLVNVRMPQPLSEEFFAVQDAYLQEEIQTAGITDFATLTPVEEGIYLWQGDITTLACDAIVNAANSAMLGCFQPNHACIDNCIHTYAGVQLRLACARIMQEQGHEEAVGTAKITSGYNLPAKHIIHTVGPVVEGPLTPNHEYQLESCYRSCLELALASGVKSIAFCCISTGVFMFPGKRAAEIAVRTVRQFQKQHPQEIEVIFNVFTDRDLRIYQNLLA